MERGLNDRLGGEIDMEIGMDPETSNISSSVSDSDSVVTSSSSTEKAFPFSCSLGCCLEGDVLLPRDESLVWVEAEGKEELRKLRMVVSEVR